MKIRENTLQIFNDGKRTFLEVDGKHIDTRDITKIKFVHKGGKPPELKVKCISCPAENLREIASHNEGKSETPVEMLRRIISEETENSKAYRFIKQ